MDKKLLALNSKQQVAELAALLKDVPFQKVIENSLLFIQVRVTFGPLRYDINRALEMNSGPKRENKMFCFVQFSFCMSQWILFPD